MGLFSGKTKVTVATKVSRVIEDKVLPNSVKVGLIKGLISSDGQIVENILEDMSGNLAVKAERMYRYAKQSYSYGLPMATLTNSAAGKSRVQAVIEDLLGKAVTMEYSHFGPFNNLHFAWQTLVDTKGYDQTSNELTSLTYIKGSKVYLVDMVVVIPEALLPTLEKGALDQWGPSASSGYTPDRPLASNLLAAPTQVRISDSAVEEYIEVTYTWRSGGVSQRETINIMVPPLVNTLNFFQAKYTYQEPVAVPVNPEVPEFRTITGYFTYQEGEGTYPELDEIYQNNYTGLGSFFPFVYFRYNKTPWCTNTTSQEYKSSKKVMKLLGMDYDIARDSINGNPDIADVEQAMLTMAVPALSNCQQEIRYLYDFFNIVLIETGPLGVPKTEISSAIQLILDKKETPGFSFVIRDALFKMALSIEGIYRKKKVGVIGAIGHYTCSLNVVNVTKEMKMYVEGEPVTNVWTVPVTHHYYRKQLTKSIYEEIRVVGLNMSYYLLDGYTTTADTLLVPLDYSITKNYSNRDREILYARSLHYVFNSKIVTKIQWYQTGLFKALLTVAAIAITVITWGADGGTALAAAFAAATASFEAFVMTILIAGMKMLLVQFAMKLFVKLVGPEIAMIFAVVLAVAAAYDYFSTEGLTGTPWAKELLTASSGLTSAANDAISEALLGIKSKAEAFGLEVQTKTELLETAKHLLEGNNLLSPFTIFGEKPSEYYERTVHSGNIGAISLDSISVYVDNALTLPKLSGTIGEIQ